MLYIGTATELPLTTSADLRIERVSEPRDRVRQWFSHPAVRFVGAHTGCSCGFPSVTCESPVQYYEGMPLESDDRQADLRSVRALIGLLDRTVTDTASVELYPVADGQESEPLRGVIEWPLDSLDPETLFFNERFMHVVHNRQPVAPRVLDA
jgi:hypothetical protein